MRTRNAPPLAGVAMVACIVAAAAAATVMLAGTTGDTAHLERGIPGTSASPIAITSDAGLEAYPGNGTAEQPHIIENLTISTTSPRVAISIKNTRKHFIIRNCTITTRTDFDDAYGVQLVNVSNALIEENTFSSNYHAIHVDNCLSIRIASNYASGASAGASNRNWRVVTAWNSTNVSIHDNVARYFRQYGARVGGGSVNVSAFNNSFTYSDIGGLGDYSGVKIAGASSCTITGNNFTGTYFGVHLDTGQDIIVANNTMHDLKVGGARVRNARDIVVSNNSMQGPNVMVGIEQNVSTIIVANNSITSNLGIDVSGTGVVNVSITGNVITGTYAGSNPGALAGIYNRQANPVSIAGNVISRIHGYGIWLDAGQGNVVSENLVNASGRYGMYLVNQNGTTVANNTVSWQMHATHGQGVRLEGSTGCTVSGNTFDKNYKAAVWLLFASTGNVIANNTCSNGGGTGLGRDAAIKLQGSTGNVVEHNTIVTIDIYGISMWSSAHANVVRGNTILASGYQGILVETSNHNVIEGNEIRDTGYDDDIDFSAIYVSEATNTTIASNLMDNNTVHAIQAWLATGLVIHDNQISNHETGIFIEDSTNVTAWQNAFLNNTVHASITGSTGITWDNGTRGNYWDDYTTRYPGAVNVGGTWDTPYQVGTSQDRYPLAWNPVMPNDVAPVPSAPRNVQATAGNGQVVLSWTEPADDGAPPVTTYSIYRSTTSGSGFAWLANTTSTQFTDATVENGQTCYYVVRAWNVAGQGIASVQVSATLPGDDRGITPAVLAGINGIIQLIAFGVVMGIVVVAHVAEKKQWFRGR